MSHAPQLPEIVRRFKAVFFDLDGTLFNSEPLHATALIEAAKECSIDLTGINPLHDFLGLPDPGVFRHLSAIGRVPSGVTQESFINAKNSHYIAHCRDLSDNQWSSVMTEGAREFLIALKKSQILTAIVSASEPDIVEVMLKGVQIHKLFDHVVARGECFRSKPSPGPYLCALRHWKLHARDALVFEDSVTGKKAATLAGCQVVAVTCFTEPKDDGLARIDNFCGLI